MTEFIINSQELVTGILIIVIAVILLFILGTITGIKFR